MLKKLFISQPMKDKTDIEIFQEINRVIDAVTTRFGGIDLIDTYITEDPPEGIKNQGLWYLGQSLILLANADIAYFVKGWDSYRGCKCEHKAAIEYGIPIIIEDE